MTSWQKAGDAQAGKGEHIGLPVRPFLYTLDQIATLISVDVKWLIARHIYLDRRTTGARSKDLMLAHNVAPDNNEIDEWRVAEYELVRWLRYKGFVVREAKWTTH